MLQSDLASPPHSSCRILVQTNGVQKNLRESHAARLARLLKGSLREAAIAADEIHRWCAVKGT